jgi:acylphosphatase
MVRKHIYYSGDVQGVGFRYTAVRVAANYAVTGYVRNLTDGRVEVVVEGEPRDVTAFLDALAEAMTGYIRDHHVIDEPSSGEFNCFDVRY